MDLYCVEIEGVRIYDCVFCSNLQKDLDKEEIKCSLCSKKIEDYESQYALHDPAGRYYFIPDFCPIKKIDRDYELKQRSETQVIKTKKALSNYSVINKEENIS